MPRPDDGTLTTTQVAELVRVTPRQLQIWAVAGLLPIADRFPGSGNLRRWTPDEVARARAFAALNHAGVVPSACAEALADADALIGPHRFSL